MPLELPMARAEDGKENVLEGGAGSGQNDRKKTVLPSQPERTVPRTVPARAQTQQLPRQRTEIYEPPTFVLPLESRGGGAVTQLLKLVKNCCTPSRERKPRVPLWVNPVSNEHNDVRVVAGGVERTNVKQDYSPLTTPRGFSTIQQAVDAATDGDVILVRPARYKIIQRIVVNKRVQIVGVGSKNKTIITNLEGGPAFHFMEDTGREPEEFPYPYMDFSRKSKHSTVSERPHKRKSREIVGVSVNSGETRKVPHAMLSNLTVQTRLGDEGHPHLPAIVVTGTKVEIMSCDITSNSGNGIEVRSTHPSEHSKVLLDNVRVCGCRGAGIEATARNATVVVSHNSAVTGNRGAGVVVQNQAQCQITRTTIESGEGEGIHSRYGGTVTLQDCRIQRNQGYGILVEGEGEARNSVLMIKNCTVAGNGNGDVETRNNVTVIEQK